MLRRLSDQVVLQVAEDAEPFPIGFPHSPCPGLALQASLEALGDLFLSLENAPWRRSDPARRALYVEGRLLILALRRVQSGWNDQMGAIGTSADNLRELNVVPVV